MSFLPYKDGSTACSDNCRVSLSRKTSVVFVAYRERSLKRMTPTKASHGYGLQISIADFKLTSFFYYFFMKTYLTTRISKDIINNLSDTAFIFYTSRQYTFTPQFFIRLITFPVISRIINMRVYR